MRRALEHHLAHCDAYAAFASRRGIAPEAISDPADLRQIAYFPTSVFKRRPLLSVAEADIVSGFTSSGTSGTRSIIYRDTLTLHRLCGMVRPDSALFGSMLDGTDDENTVILNLGTSRQDSQHVWFGYVMSLLEQVAPTSFYTRDGVVDLDGAIADARRCLAGYERVFLVGPPFLVADFCRAVLAAGPPLDGRDALVVFTGGGWKSREDERLDPGGLATLLEKALGLAGRAVIRDVFNQVELNTLLVECARGSKHVPPWVNVFARDPVTFEPVPDGETGVLTFADASAHSYPCFYIGDDLGRVDADGCPCGLPGLTMRVQARLRGATHGGCAATMAGGRQHAD
jgi:long-chain-fatty-acid---luciferin-component ligase